MSYILPMNAAAPGATGRSYGLSEDCQAVPVDLVKGFGDVNSNNNHFFFCVVVYFDNGHPAESRQTRDLLKNNSCKIGPNVWAPLLSLTFPLLPLYFRSTLPLLYLYVPFTFPLLSLPFPCFPLI